MLQVFSPANSEAPLRRYCARSPRRGSPHPLCRRIASAVRRFAAGSDVACRTLWPLVATAVVAVAEVPVARVDDLLAPRAPTSDDLASIHASLPVAAELVVLASVSPLLSAAASPLGFARMLLTPASGANAGASWGRADPLGRHACLPVAAARSGRLRGDSRPPDQAATGKWSAQRRPRAGGPRIRGRGRTCNLSGWSRVLCQLSYAHPLVPRPRRDEQSCHRRGESLTGRRGSTPRDPASGMTKARRL